MIHLIFFFLYLYVCLHLYDCYQGRKLKQNNMVVESLQRNRESLWILTALAAEVLRTLETDCVEDQEVVHHGTLEKLKYNIFI